MPLIVRPCLSPPELAKVLGARAVQLAGGHPSAVPLDSLPEEKRYLPLEIAREEYRRGVLPMKVIITLPDGKSISKDLSEFYHPPE